MARIEIDWQDLEYANHPRIGRCYSFSDQSIWYATPGLALEARFTNKIRGYDDAEGMEDAELHDPNYIPKTNSQAIFHARYHNRERARAAGHDLSTVKGFERINIRSTENGSRGRRRGD